MKFSSSDGANPYAPLVQASDGSFYGTTFTGGASGYGTVFKLDPAGTLTTVHSFDWISDGVAPRAGLIQASDGSFYGTTNSGGPFGYGTVLKLDAAGALTTLHSFTSSDGAYSRAPLIQAEDGSLYGTTIEGGPNGGGAVFRLTVNHPPVTAGHSYSIAAETPLTVAAPGVLANDTDAEWRCPLGRPGDGARHGTLTLNANGAFTYTPAAGYKWPDSFTYKANDGIADSNVAVVSITITSKTASLIYPATNATNADMGQPITWTAVPGAGGYYLYVGTSVGAKNVVNTGEIQTTSYRAVNVPPGVALYARPGTKLIGVWRFADTTFTAAPLADFITATDGATNVDVTQAIRWTSVDNAQAYYLYVGSSPGGKDLLNTGELQATSYPASRLPTAQLLYARLWTKVANHWRYTDITFTARAAVARFTYPATAGATIDPAQPLTWTAVVNVQAYYLYVGSAPGAKDFVNSGEIQQTPWLLRSGLPAGQTLYARLWTKLSGIWRYVDTTFVIP